MRPDWEDWTIFWLVVFLAAVSVFLVSWGIL